jgi:tetratricopeptide (TPR) repeat protein
VAENHVLLRTMGAWYIAGGAITLISAVVVCFLEFSLGALLAIPAFILLVLIGSMQLSAGRTIWSSQVGSWRSIIITSIMTLLARGLFIMLLWGNVFTSHGVVLPWESSSLGVWMFYLNMIWVAVEAVFFVYLYLHPDFFMLKECEDGVRPDLATCTIKSVSECPHCHEVVETHWQSCPYCGTKLPSVCGECGGALENLMVNCPHCGAEVMRSVSMQKTVDMFRKLTEEDALPETKAVHFARLAEALLKNGQPDEAVAAYRQAISLTHYPRKRTNFLVQTARILANTGHENEARKLLDEALAIDPKDIAGANQVWSEIVDRPAPS